MTELFSPAWFDTLEQALSAISPAELPEQRLALGQVITGGSGGEVRYTLILAAGEPARLIRDNIADADVTLVESYETAVAIASGTPAGELLAAGKVKVRGDANALLVSQAGFSALALALSEISSPTAQHD